MSLPILIALLQNAALLLAMVVVFEIATSRSLRRLRSQDDPGSSADLPAPTAPSSRLRRGLHETCTGLVLGLLGVGLIVSSFQLEPGAVFDTRSVLLGASGLFLGPLPTLVAMTLTAAYRLWGGGLAAWAGVAVIFTSGSIGVLWRHYRRGSLADISWRELYSFGLIIHVVMLTLMLTLPWENARRVLSSIGLPVLLIYPAATTALGLLLARRLQHERNLVALAESETRYRSLFENNQAVMLLIGPEGAIVDANPAASRFYGWSRDQLRQMHITQINTLPPDQVQAEMRRAREEHHRYFLFPHRLANGNLRTVEVYSSPVTLAGQPLLHSIIHDVTARHEAEAQIAEQLDELRRWHQMTLGRETRVLELKCEINELLHQLELPPRYPSALHDLTPLPSQLPPPTPPPTATPFPPPP